jgi:hypothetical protein
LILRLVGALLVQHLAAGSSCIFGRIGLLGHSIGGRVFPQRKRSCCSAQRD